MYGIELERNSEISMSRQIYSAIRDRITEGILNPGETLPSTRSLSVQLSVSRNTVCEAYEMLTAEGYINSRQGSASRVTEGLEIKRADASDKVHIKAAHNESIETIDFRTGRPDIGRFPVHQWLKLMHKASESLPPDQWGYAGPAGLPALRREIAGWLFRSRSIKVPSENIFVTSGATQALHILSEILSGAGGEILVEDPCHTGMLSVLQLEGIKTRPAAVDRHGLIVNPPDLEGACAVYTTPSHQFPLGGILPAARRASLIKHAAERGIYIIEDDYDSEFRYCGPPIAPLYGMDPERVIYVGTFSKIMFPALRIGYIILPSTLHRQWMYTRTHSDIQNPPFEQAALAEYLRSRKLDRHVQKMRRLYGHRRLVLLQALKDNFGNSWLPWGDSAGLHLAAEFPGIYFDSGFTGRCRSAGLRITTVERHSIKKGAHTDKILLGYGHLKDEEIHKGIDMLSNVIKDGLH